MSLKMLIHLSLPLLVRLLLIALMMKMMGVIVRHTYQQCARLKNSEVLANLCSSLSHLPDSQRFGIEQLIHDFPSLFHDVPTRTTVLKHDIDVNNASPIKQHAYRVNAVKRSVMKNEVAYLLKNGLAKPSCSPGVHLAYWLPKATDPPDFAQIIAR